MRLLLLPRILQQYDDAVAAAIEQAETGGSSSAKKKKNPTDGCKSAFAREIGLNQSTGAGIGCVLRAFEGT